MKKAFLALFILVDLALMAAAGYFLYRRMTAGAAAMPMKISREVPAIHTSTMTASGGLLTSPASTAVPAEGNMRKILFTYPNAKARQVAIRADFTGWKAEVMNRNDKGVWTYQATLAPGEYAYCYTVDDKTFKDPANKKTKQIGRTFVSAITVEALK